MTSILEKYNDQQLRQLLEIPAHVTGAEFEAIKHQLEVLKLDPTLKQAYVMDMRGKYQVIVSINGYRVIAARIAGDTLSISAPLWCKDDGEFREAITGKPLACKITVKRGDKEFSEIVYFSEYNTGKNLWASKPMTMIAKVAEAHALRKAFPEALGAAYIPEEVERAINKKPSEPVFYDLKAVSTIEELQVLWDSLPDAAKKRRSEDFKQRKNEIEGKNDSDE